MPGLLSQQPHQTEWNTSCKKRISHPTLLLYKLKLYYIIWMYPTEKLTTGTQKSFKKNYRWKGESSGPNLKIMQKNHLVENENHLNQKAFSFQSSSRWFHGAVDHFYSQQFQRPWTRLGPSHVSPRCLEWILTTSMQVEPGQTGRAW